MSFISRFKSLARYRAFWICVLLFALLELAVRVLPIEYAAGTGVFLANYRRQLLESETPEFDYIIFGESRSLALNGHAPTPEEPFSVYNLSVPAMGSRYYQYYLRKYAGSREHLPAALIFAGDPGIFQEYWNQPIHDPTMVYTDSREDGLTRYLWKRLHVRVERALEGKSGWPRGVASGGNNQGLWENYSHRYLHLFSFTEIAAQYNGAERMFMISESLPLLYRTYKWREPIAHYTAGLRMSYFKAVEIPAYCSQGCAGAERPECFPDLQRIQRNELLDEHMRASYGQANLGDLIGPKERIEYALVRETQVQNQRRIFNENKPDLRPLEALLEEAGRLGIPVALAATPTVDAYADTSFYRQYNRQLKQMLERHPGVRVFEFARPYYPPGRFVDQIHYDCEGAEQVNADFYDHVIPQIVNWAPPHNDGRQRGFSD